MSENPLGEELVEHLVERFPESELTHSTTLPAQPARYAEWPEWVLPELRAALEEQGVAKLYAHQVAVAQAAWEGRDVVVSTGTSSGKSLGYRLPILSRLAQDPTACALYITPTKALGSDQLRTVLELTQGIAALHDVHPAPDDGATPPQARAGIRDQARVIFANPDNNN